MNHQRDDDEHEALMSEVVDWLTTDPDALPRIIAELPDPRAVALLKALSPAIAATQRRLILLAAMYRSTPRA